MNKDSKTHYKMKRGTAILKEFQLIYRLLGGTI